MSHQRQHVLCKGEHVPLGRFIEQPPHHNTRVVTVARKGFRPRIDPPLALLAVHGMERMAVLPETSSNRRHGCDGIQALSKHQDTHFVIQVQQFRRHDSDHVPDGIEAHGFEIGDFSPKKFFVHDGKLPWKTRHRDHGPQHQLLSIQGEGILFETKLAQTESHGSFMNRRGVRLPHADLQSV